MIKRSFGIWPASWLQHEKVSQQSLDGRIARKMGQIRALKQVKFLINKELEKELFELTALMEQQDR